MLGWFQTGCEFLAKRVFRRFSRNLANEPGLSGPKVVTSYYQAGLISVVLVAVLDMPDRIPEESC